MYNVPARFHTLAISDSPKTRCRIYFISDAVNCWDDNDVQTNGTLLVGAAGDTDSNGRIGKDGVTVTEIYNKDKNLTIGGTVSYQIGLTLVNWDGALNNFAFGRCKVYLDVYDDANSTWLPCPLGVFRIELPVKRKVQLISCTGYDQMQVLNTIADTWWNGLNFTGGLTIANILNSMVTQLGLHLSATSSTNMVNKTLSFTTPPIDSVERTYRDILGWIAEATGTVAHFNRDGELDMRQYLTPQIGGNNIVIDTDTTGNQCLSIDIAEYSVSQIDALTIKLTTADQGVTVGSGTNAYTIMDNPFLYGPDVATIQSKLTPIYNRLSAYATYSPISTGLIYDWSIEAGDIIYILNNSATYNMPIFQQRMVWRGGYVTSELISSGDTVRPQVSSGERETYRYNVEMATKVGDNEIISKINQTAEQVQIQASKVNLTGYITATNLATEGQTVINGGNIATGTITADKLNANNINASKTLTVGALTDAAAATVLNSNIAIGGRNLCTGTATAKTLTTAANQNYFIPSVYPLSAYSATALSDASNTQVTVSFDYSITGVDTVFSLTVGFYSGQGYNEIVIAKADIPIGSSTGHAEATKDITDNMRQHAHENGVLFSGSGNANANAVLTVSNLKVEIGNKATTWTQAPEDVAADIAAAQSTAEGANSQEQLIYISKVSGTTTQSATTTWITDTTGNQNTWTIKRPVYNSSYPVLFVATQRKSVGGTVTCTTPQIDQTTTVIDGGHITTGTIDAGVVNVTNINASNITTGTISADRIAAGSLSISKLDSSTQNTITTAASDASTALVNAATAQNTANGANSQEQLIYISKVSGTASVSGTTTWVTNTTGNQNTWTIKRPTYNSSYPVLFVATQRKSVGGTVTCTTPQIDNTTTVIDGGHITTGTIDASVVSVTNLNASNITSGTMSASKISGGTLTLGGSNNTNGTMTVLDANGVTASTVDNTGITVNGTQAIGGTDMPTTLVLSDGSVVSQTNGENSFKVGRNSLGGGFLSIFKQISGVGGTLNNAGITFFDGTKPKIRYDYDGFSLRYDNGYGVTDSPAVRMYHDNTESRLTFATPPGDSGASTVIGSAGSTFGANTTFSANATVNGVLDVTNRRTSAVNLSALGWYRAIKIVSLWRGGRNFAIDICIGRVYNSTDNEIHRITLLVNYDSFAFVNETSKSNTKIISAIRYTHDSNGNGYIDIQYSSSSGNYVYVDFDAHCHPENMANYVAQSLQSVADSPSGETVLAEYTFAANATPLRFTVTTTPVLVTDYGTPKFTVDAVYYDLGHIGIVRLNPGTSVLQGVSFSTLLELENLPFTAISASGYVRSLGSNQDGMDTWQLSGDRIFLRKQGGGNLVGTFGTNPLLQVTIIGVK